MTGEWKGYVRALIRGRYEHGRGVADALVAAASVRRGRGCATAAGVGVVGDGRDRHLVPEVWERLDDEVPELE